MTEYTARSFEKAQLAHHPDGRVAARINDHEYPWAGISEGGARENFGDGEMARKGWVPGPHGHYTRHSAPDYADGGVTAAAIEKETEQPRPLAADDITDGMVVRARRSLKKATGYDYAYATVHEALTAALTEPQRPAWADLADTLRAIDPAETLSIDDLAEAAHEHGVRVTEQEQS